SERTAGDPAGNRQFRGEGPRGSASEDGDALHFLTPAGGRFSGEGIFPSEGVGPPGMGIPPPCGFSIAGAPPGIPPGTAPPCGAVSASPNTAHLPSRRSSL